MTDLMAAAMAANKALSDQMGEYARHPRENSAARDARRDCLAYLERELEAAATAAGVDVRTLDRMLFGD